MLSSKKGEGRESLKQGAGLGNLSLAAEDAGREETNTEGYDSISLALRWLEPLDAGGNRVGLGVSWAVGMAPAKFL
jgi:hypothetical protein